MHEVVRNLYMLLYSTETQRASILQKLDRELPALKVTHSGVRHTERLKGEITQTHNSVLALVLCLLIVVEAVTRNVYWSVQTIQSCFKVSDDLK